MTADGVWLVPAERAIVFGWMAVVSEKPQLVSRRNDVVEGDAEVVARRRKLVPKNIEVVLNNLRSIQRHRPLVVLLQKSFQRFRDSSRQWQKSSSATSGHAIGALMAEKIAIGAAKAGTRTHD